MNSNAIDRRVYFDMDNVLVDFPSAFKHLDEDTKERYKDDMDEIDGIFSLMQPLEGAIETFQLVSKYYDTYILSTAPWENPSAWSDKLNWVKKHLGQSAYKRLILSHNKHLNSGDYLIDDRTANGADKFKGHHLHFGSEDCPDWDSVKAYLHLDLLDGEFKHSLKDLIPVRETWLKFDPIGVIDPSEPFTWNEYDCYLDKTIDVLQKKDDLFEDIQSYLAYVTTENMGLQVDEDSMSQFSRELNARIA